MKFLLSLFFYIIGSYQVSAQLFKQKDDVSKGYTEAVRDIKNGKYQSAMQKLAPLTSANQPTIYSEYAHYHYGVAAYKNKQYQASKQMLLQLLNRYPNWNRTSEVYYLIGANNLGLRNWKEGNLYFDKIKDSSFQEDIQSLKQQYLQQYVDFDSLVEMQKQFPQDREIALELVSRIDKKSSHTKSEVTMATQLQKRFNIELKPKEDSPKSKTTESERLWGKGYYDVAVLLPFRLDAFTVSRRMSNQFAYDYYLGLLQAQKKLESEGISVVLSAYDVSTDEQQMKGIIENPSFQNSNLVIGPLYTSTFDVTMKYLAKSPMLLVNPLSTDANLLGSAKNLFLAHPTIQTQVEKGASFMKKTAKGAKAVIYYGNSSKDSTMAFAYREELKKLGGQILDMQKLPAERESMETLIPTFEQERPDHVAVFGTSSRFGQPLLATLDNRNLGKTPILATASSFNMRQVSLASAGKSLYLLESDYVDKDKEEMRKFQKDYWEVNSTFPSVYSYQGYDHLLFFGRMMGKYNAKFDQGLTLRRYESDQDGYLLGGFDYRHSHENQVPFILKYNGTKWVTIH
ncbi:ABC-type branched-subunit amino acid transport system substrate-binding protein [Dyadobacter jejuensis]|uniref:ABC-type branched-subunit amino acid transport system substrate-binding protein n=1 Tax=Dyadobacter jejuensis TaxID=1082580 RepID=A0A316AN97_9BACT|nr:ABC transporter substrate-binding protein [Dyadobacter jejuensis]PWJ59012.1 ABC-type branched-subunit amino acid transport system substrate-binding protein [Dyadobacter jejuensis]